MLAEIFEYVRRCDVSARKFRPGHARWLTFGEPEYSDYEEVLCRLCRTACSNEEE
jgi:hypothetical protein